MRIELLFLSQMQHVVLNTLHLVILGHRPTDPASIVQNNNFGRRLVIDWILGSEAEDDELGESCVSSKLRPIPGIKPC